MADVILPSKSKQKRPRDDTAAPEDTIEEQKLSKRAKKKLEQLQVNL